MDLATAAILGFFTLMAIKAWTSAPRKQREMELRYELYRRMVEHPGPEAERVRELLEKDAARRELATRTGQRGGGAVVLAVALGFGTFLYFIAPDRPVYLLALVPGFVGLVVLVSGLRSARKESPL